jgi:electron transport complex protein RnfE
MNEEYRDIRDQGLWNNNVALVQLLGLCPLLAVTTSAINGLGLGLATLLVLLISSTLVSVIRNVVRPEIRLPTFVLIIASAVTAIELAMNAWFHELYGILGIFIPLIVTNCGIIGRAEGFASRNPILPSMFDALMMGLGFAAVLVVLGALREMIGQGTLFADAHLMFGEAARGLALEWEAYEGFLLAVLPPGAFIGLGLLIAVKNVVDARAAARPAPAPEPEPEAAAQG